MALATVIWLLGALVVAFVVWKVGHRDAAQPDHAAAAAAPGRRAAQGQPALPLHVCGMEIRLTRATDEDPEPPRHCQEDMDLVAPVE